MSPPEHHRLNRSSWLRAAVLGANDGIVSTASMLIGVATAGSDKQAILIAGVAALVAGAMSMAAGEYVSVSSQADTEAADLALERTALHEHPQEELEELRDIYIKRGLNPELAAEVAQALMRHDALEAHARDEIGITDAGKARPLQAAFASALAFTAGAALPVLVALLLPLAMLPWGLASSSLVFLGGLGAVAAHAGGASMSKGALRVCVWSAGAMALTALVGSLFGVNV
ncbi:MAG: VIT family protein [Pseudomonadales bacterium]|jgi:VIT1/CCC1 family predicted Fe2+/Mn2+ transporter|nr:VIT family protein [Pseudomonadales bacterium]